jgi:hypothetical protein
MTLMRRLRSWFDKDPLRRYTPIKLRYMFRYRPKLLIKTTSGMDCTTRPPSAVVPESNLVSSFCLPNQNSSNSPRIGWCCYTGRIASPSSLIETIRLIKYVPSSSDGRLDGACVA